jgi:hypothetical protein
MSPRFPDRATRFKDAADYLWQRAVQAVAEGWRWSGQIERLTVNGEERGVRAIYTDESGQDHQSIYIYDDHTGQGHYRRLFEADPLPVVTAPACDLERYLIRHAIPHAVIGRFAQTREYQGIAALYGDKRAARSGVYYMHHIDEGLRVLRDVGASQEAMKAYCLHPVVQEDSALVANARDLQRYSEDPYVHMLMMEYRHIANGALSHHALTCAADIALGPMPEVADMLRADKVQNYKDFLLYHAQTHPRRDALQRYFTLWLERLDISPAQMAAWREQLNVPRWTDAGPRK